MESLGRYLREEREQQGKTLNQITERTRISRTILQAIEAGRQDELPQASYLRGLIKLYAQELGLNEDDVLARLPSTEEESPRLLPLRTISIAPSRKPLRMLLLAGVLACAAAILVWYLLFVSVGPVTDPEPQHDPAVLDMPDTDPEVAFDTDTVTIHEAEINESVPDVQPHIETVESTTPAVTEPIELQFTARRIVWIQLQANDRQAREITLRPGERYRTRADEILHVRIGDPTAVEVLYNNAAVTLPDTPGVPHNMVFPDTVQTHHSDAE